MNWKLNNYVESNPNLMNLYFYLFRCFYCAIMSSTVSVNMGSGDACLCALPFIWLGFYKYTQWKIKTFSPNIFLFLFTSSLSRVGDIQIVFIQLYFLYCYSLHKVLNEKMSIRKIFSIIYCFKECIYLFFICWLPFLFQLKHYPILS